MGAHELGAALSEVIEADHISPPVVVIGLVILPDRPDILESFESGSTIVAGGGVLDGHSRAVVDAKAAPVVPIRGVAVEQDPGATIDGCACLIHAGSSVLKHKSAENQIVSMADCQSGSACGNFHFRGRHVGAGWRINLYLRRSHIESAGAKLRSRHNLGHHGAIDEEHLIGDDNWRHACIPSTRQRASLNCIRPRVGIDIGAGFGPAGEQVGTIDNGCACDACLERDRCGAA